MKAQDLKNSILQLAIQGKLVEQREEEGKAKELLKKIEAEKKQLIKDGKIKKQKALAAIKEDEIPFDIPESWEWVRLGDALDIARGGSPRPIKAFITDSEDGVNWIKIGDTDKGGKYINGTNEKIIKEGIKKSRFVKKGDFLLSNSMSFGRPYILNIDGCIHDGWLVLSQRVKVFNKDFLYHLLSSRMVFNQFQSIVSGAVVNNLNSDKVRLTIVPIPPLEEQKRIVAKIEEMMPYVDKYNVAYSEVEELNKKFPEDMKKSILQYAIQGKLVEQQEEDGTAEELYKQIQEEKKRLIKEGKIKKPNALPEITEDEIPFDIPESWKWVRLADVTENIHYGYTASANNTGNCKLLRITDIQDNCVDWEYVPYCDVKDKDFATYGINNRDIMIARTGGTIGKTYIVEELEDKAVFASYLIRAIPVKGINEKYLKKFMESPVYWVQLKAGSMGTGQPNVNGTTLSKLVLPLPPFDEQQRIVDELEVIIPYTKRLIK